MNFLKIDGCFKYLIFCLVMISFSNTQGIAADWPILDKDGKVIQCNKLYNYQADISHSPNALACRIQEFEEAENYKDAVPYADGLLKIVEKTVEKTDLKLNPKYLTGTLKNLNYLAKIYYKAGNYEKAEGLYKRSLELGKSVPPIMWQTNLRLSLEPSAEGLIEIYNKTNRKYEEIEKLFIELIKSREEVLGEESIINMTLYSRFGNFYLKNAKYEDAENYYMKALKVIRKTFEMSPAYFRGNNGALGAMFKNMYGKKTEGNINLLFVENAFKGLAFIYHKLGQSEKIKALYSEDFNYFLDKFSNKATYSFGAVHPMMIPILNSFATIFGNNDPKFSHDLFVKNSDFINKMEESEMFKKFSWHDSRIDYLRNSQIYVHSFISHTSQYMKPENDAVKDTFKMWAKYKGSVIDFDSRFISAVKKSGKSDVKKKFKEYKDLDLQLSRLLLHNDIISKEKYIDIKGSKMILALELVELLKPYLKREDIDIGNIIDALPKDSVYIDFAKINLFDFQTQKFGEERYFAFVIQPNKNPAISFVEIGVANEIDTLIGDYHNALGSFLSSGGHISYSARMKQIGMNLYDNILKPLESYIYGQKKIIISPDGELNLISFEAFVKPDGEYVIEDYLISYITSANEILSFKQHEKLAGNAVIIADPDYDLGVTAKNRAGAGNDAIFFRGHLSDDMKNLVFKRLPDTKVEANNIEKILKGKMKISIRNYQDKAAVDEVLYSVKSPKILHIATHGFFLKNSRLEFKNEDFVSDEKKEENKLVAVKNPMSRSGIVLTGANTSLKLDLYEGIMTADKIVGLDLKDTELVVLSACETGVGNIEKGDGVYGLKKAFALAGAKSLVTSLWSVPSIETTELMTQFYSLLSEGKSKSEALREAKLGMLKKKENPFYWGAFVLSGNPN